MHIDWQQIMAMAIVAAATAAVGRRIWSQIAAFRTKPGKAGGGCDGCPSGGAAKNAQAVPAPLMQIQTRPPAHLRRPSAK